MDGEKADRYRDPDHDEGSRQKSRDYRVGLIKCEAEEQNSEHRNDQPANQIVNVERKARTRPPWGR